MKITIEFEHPCELINLIVKLSEAGLNQSSIEQTTEPTPEPRYTLLSNEPEAEVTEPEAKTEEPEQTEEEPEQTEKKNRDANTRIRQLNAEKKAALERAERAEAALAALAVRTTQKHG